MKELRYICLLLALLVVSYAMAELDGGNIVLKDGGGNWNDGPIKFDTSYLKKQSKISLMHEPFFANYENRQLSIGSNKEYCVQLVVFNRLTGQVFNDIVECPAGVWVNIDGRSWTSGVYTLRIIVDENISWYGDFIVQ